MQNFNLPLNLRLIKKCPVCQHEYKQAMVQVLDESEYGVLTYATCINCGANLLTKFSSMPQGVVGNAILTDLKPAEVMFYADTDELSEDEVLAIQQIIYKKELLNNLNNK